MRKNIGDCVAERIMNLCREHNITLNKLGTICGINQSTLNNIVSRTNRCANVATVKKICDGLNISIVEFFNSEEFKDLPQEIV
ncbi:MAG: helix-turn-helix transcriptional regulator [Erysipelotrichaceae bacterium]|nr:helix-turn-helix transcriptional regulator [Erysipelotrichaceae bacterium]